MRTRILWASGIVAVAVVGLYLQLNGAPKRSEDQLVDAYITAQRAAERASVALVEFCKSTNQELKVKGNALLGCVAPQPAPSPAKEEVKK